MLNTLAAQLFALLAAVVVVFQAGLIFGAPLGHLTLGGKYQGRLPPLVRLVPALSAVLLSAFACVVLARAGLAFPRMAASAPLLVWFVVAYCAVGVLANLFTPSAKERAIWLPVVLLMLVTSSLVAAS